MRSVSRRGQAAHVVDGKINFDLEESELLLQAIYSTLRKLKWPDARLFLHVRQHFTRS
jgi:hypothetical protein